MSGEPGPSAVKRAIDLNGDWMLHRPVAYLGLALSLVAAPRVRAQSSRPADRGSAPTSRPASTTQPAGKGPYRSRVWGGTIEPDPPGYVRTLSKTGLPGTESLNWLDFGAEHRTRWEIHDDDYRRDRLIDDNRFLMRSRTFIGIHDIVDPFRAGVEFMDARQFNSDFPTTNLELNEADFLQAYGELYFKDALGKDEPLRLQAGRMSFDYIDRKVVGRNRWRNTVNAFDGFRLQMGKPDAPWQFDFLAVQPVERRTVHLDRTDEERWLYGLVGSWRGWTDWIILQPYYFILDEDHKPRDVADREVHTMGLHVYGLLGKSGFDYDIDTLFQFGEDGQREIRAFAGYGEVGYTFAHPWKPRLSFTGTYSSGDHDPTDDLNERFERLYGTSSMWSRFNHISWQNMIQPRIRIEFQPIQQLRFDASYMAHWLASDSDAWVLANRRDTKGRSGDFVAQEVDVRARYQIDPRVEIEVGYSHLFPGPFLENTGQTDDSDFFYVQTTMQLFE